MDKSAYDQKYYEYKIAVEAALERALVLPQTESRVFDAMRYSLLDGGKRIRGILALAACEMLGGDYEQALPAACAVEMIHAYSLVHDDLPCMDNDDMRRGKPSCHKEFGETVALLAGDALNTLAFCELAKIQDPAASRYCVLALANAGGYLGMVLGQELDLNPAEKAIEELRDTDKLKTGALMDAAFVMGAVVAGCDQDRIERLRAGFSANIGLAFQVVDDVLDVTATAEMLGKPIGSDVEQGKNTFASLLGIEESKKLARELTQTAVKSLGNNCHNSEKTEFLAALALQLQDRIN